jgi:hypothetical protein
MPICSDRPLFIPLRREWFEAFARGKKREEWRRYGAGWNERSCPPGRRVVLSLGYSGDRLHGTIRRFSKRAASGPAVDIYGAGTLCAVIAIDLD